MIRILVTFALRILLTIAAIFLIQTAIFHVFTTYNKSCQCECAYQESPVNGSDLLKDTIPLWERTINFTGFNNETGTADGRYIVPNYIHFLKFRTDTFHLMHMVCVMAAFKHQKPDKLFIHTDVKEFHGKYWEVLINTPGFKEVLVINKMVLPTEVFGQSLNPDWVPYHGADVARLMVMMKYGGIYLDNDSYLIRRMDDLRRFEFAVAWRPGMAMMNQVVVAHKDARLLKEWYDGYKDYKETHWFYNAGRYPANVLLEKPYLAHTLRDLLGTYDIRRLIYLRKWQDWKSYYSCHLMIRWVRSFKGLHYPYPMTEKDVLQYNNTFLEMIQDVYDVKKVKLK